LFNNISVLLLADKFKEEAFVDGALEEDRLVGICDCELVLVRSGVVLIAGVQCVWVECRTRIKVERGLGMFPVCVIFPGSVESASPVQILCAHHWFYQFKTSEVFVQQSRIFLLVVIAHQNLSEGAAFRSGQLEEIREN
jgi:hypothetical protein